MAKDNGVILEARLGDEKAIVMSYGILDFAKGDASRLIGEGYSLRTNSDPLFQMIQESYPNAAISYDKHLKKPYSPVGWG
jgi:hypothetical protein